MQEVFFWRSNLQQRRERRRNMETGVVRSGGQGREVRLAVLETQDQVGPFDLRSCLDQIV